MRVQLVSEGMEDAIEKMKSQEPDLTELNYSSPAEPTSDFSIDHKNDSPTPPKRRVLTAGNRGDDERTLNRAERRRQKGR